ncbi:restriction endonuclease subunit S [Vibrio atlanticus]
MKKLRELILELAVRGKLTSGLEFRGSSETEMKKTVEEKEVLAKARKIRADKEVYSETAMNVFPPSWQVVHIGQFAHVLGGKRVPKGYKLTEEATDFTYLRVTDMKNQSIDESDLRYISEEVFEQISRYVINMEDVYVTIAGTIGAVGTIPPHLDGASLTENAAKLVFRGISKEYLIIMLQSKFVQSQFGEAVNQMAQPKLSLSSIKQTLVSIPTLDEQVCIAEKVDELMTLCDQLEQQTEASIEAHQVLVITLLDTLTNSANAEELMQNWQMVAEHFDTLFTTEASIDQLKQTILQLAVMGKLSKPLDSDTPVSNHLDSILEQQKLTASAKEFKLIEAELESAKAEVGANRVMLKARCFCDFITKGTTPSKTELLEIGDVPFLKVYNIVDNQLDFDYRPIFISQGVHEGKLKRSMASSGDVIMNIVGPPLGKVTILTDQYTQWNMNQALAVFKPVDVVFNRYLYYVLSCDLTLNSVLKEVKGTAGQDNLSLEQCRDLLIPIIGIEEQKRLVELVDILLDLCKFLKTRLKDSQTTQLHLTDAILEQAI